MKYGPLILDNLCNSSFSYSHNKKAKARFPGEPEKMTLPGEVTSYLSSVSFRPEPAVPTRHVLPQSNICWQLETTRRKLQ